MLATPDQYSYFWKSQTYIHPRDCSVNFSTSFTWKRKPYTCRVRLSFKIISRMVLERPYYSDAFVLRFRINTSTQGGIPDFFLGGGALVSCSTSTPMNHIVFFLQNTSCIRKPQVISGGGGGAHPLHPSPRSAPVKCRRHLSNSSQSTFIVQTAAKYWDL